MLELTLCCTSQWTWASAFSPLSFFLLPFLPVSFLLFVWSSHEMKMIISHYVSKKLMKVEEDVPHFITKLFAVLILLFFIFLPLESCLVLFIVFEIQHY